MKMCVLRTVSPLFIKAILLLTILLSVNVLYAEGSRDLYPSGAQGYRAYLLSSTTDANFNPFATPGTVRVWVKPGETIYVGSSVIGKRWPSTTGTYPAIVLRSPDGQTYTLGGSSATTGLIADRTQEINGPNRTGVTNGYTPLTRVVQTGQGGIWEVDFIGLGSGTNIPAPTTGAQPTGTYFGNTYTSTYDGNYLANANWVQPLSYGSNVPVALIAAWDVSVGSASNASTLIPGRAFTTLFSGTAPNSRFHEPSFYSKFYVLTPEGNAYLVNNNGQNGASFNFFSNNKGAVTSLNNGQPTYQSINTSTFTSLQTVIWDPRIADGQGNITNKLFFNKPASDLPASASIRYNGGAQTTTWLKNTPVQPVISDLRIVGRESGVLSGTVGPQGAIISFHSNVEGMYKVLVDVNDNNSYEDDVDVIIVGSCLANEITQVVWDGRNGLGVKVSENSNVKIRGAVSVSEIHFPYSDVESNLRGVIIYQLDQNYDTIPGKDIVYWNDENITGVSIGASSPVENHIIGRKSTVNGHIWGSNLSANSTETNQFGNNKTLDTWTFLESVPATVITSVQKYTVDLAVNSVTPNKSSLNICGDTIEYIIEVENKSSAIAKDAAYGARFEFTHPQGLNIFNVTYTPTTGTSSVIANTDIIQPAKYSTFLNMANGAKGVFRIRAHTSTLLYNQSNLSVRGAIIRPADYEDIDATDETTITGPVDALVECNGLPSGMGCNNLVSNSNVATIFCSSAQIDKSSSPNKLFNKGDTITYTIKYINTDPFSHTGINITDNLPSAATFVPGSMQVSTTTPYQQNIKDTIRNTGNTSFSVPSGVTSLTIEAWGAGAGGGGRSSGTNVGGGGGGGGAYTRKTISVNQGGSYIATVGSGGAAATAGGDSYFRLNSSGTNITIARGGSSPGTNSSTGGNGGSATSSDGDIFFNGGAGSSGTSMGSTSGFGGGGGAAAGPSGAGTAATSFAGATGVTGSGSGGDGRLNNPLTASTTGSIPGGGGGGGFRTSSSVNGSSGGNGQIVLSYTRTYNPGTVGTFPNVASNWSVNPFEEVIVTYKVVVNQNFDGDSIKNIASATSTIVTTPIRDSVTNYRTVNLTGNIFNDANGLKDNTVNGTGLGNPAAETLYVHLVDSQGKVIMITPAATNGQYSFANVNTGNFTVLISNIQGIVNQSAPAHQLPANWVNTGENIGIQAGHDGVVNGITPVNVTNKDILNINFGINALPYADTTTLEAQYNPGGTVHISIPSTSFGGTDENGHIDSLRITTFPTNTTSITINGINYTSSNFPAGGVTIPTNSSGEPTVIIAIDPIDGTVTSSIPYVTIDNAGFESSNIGYVHIPFILNTTYAVNDENSTWVNTPVSGDVTTNDFDLEGHTQSFGSFLNQNGSGNPVASGVTVSGKDANGNTVNNAGTLTFNPNGTYTYTPANNFTGNISVPYSICDNGNPVACDTAYLDITVSPLPNIANSIIANNDEYFSYGEPVNANVFVNDADPQGDSFTVTGVKQGNTSIPVGIPTQVSGVDEKGNPVANAGTLTQSADGTMTYVPAPGFAGTVTYDYTITDDDTPVATDNATVVITAVRDNNGPQNDPPFAGDDFSYTSVNTPVNGNFAGNDDDPNNDPISIADENGNPVTIVPGGPKTSVVTKTTEKGGTVEFFSDGTYTYTPPTGYTGPDRVVYEICDVTVIEPQPLCAQATIHLLIAPRYKISGKVWHDTNGMTDNFVNGTNGTNVSNKVFAVLTDVNGRVINSIPVDENGNYEFLNVPGGINLQVLLDTISRAKDEIVQTSALPTGWVNTGEKTRSQSGHDGNINGISAVIPALTADVDSVMFGIQQPPFADSKLFNVGNIAFREGAPDNYPKPDEFERFFTITTGSEYLTGNGRGGFLTGKDPEDCPEEQTCYSGSNFKLIDLYPTTVLFYNYGGETGIRRLEEGDLITNYNPSNLIIYAEEGSGMGDKPVGFRYAMIDAAGFSSAPASYTIISESALPVELLYFTANSSDCKVTLNWATASELNNDYFEVEKSTDAVQWATIGKVDGNGNTNFRIDYSYADDILDNGTIYYRLKQVDFDGGTEYHKTVAIETQKCSNHSISAYPNPTQNILNVRIDKLNWEDAHVTIIDASGKTIKSLSINNTYTHTTLDVSSLSSGFYFLQINIGNLQTESIPFVITK